MTNSETAVPAATAKHSTREGPYHHGDLRNALVRAAAELAETGGPEAVTVRAAARHVGVTPTAAYRHFTNHDELLNAAQEQAQQTLFAAMGETMASLAPQADAISRLAAVGRGYITFALREPGLFRTAFCGDQSDAPAYDLLAGLLDELVTIGFLDAADRPDAEYAAWSMVHGMATLIIEGALDDLDDAARDKAIQRTLAVVERGLATGPNASERGAVRR
ncbi:TetR/AcrR family transcriptional regulator [Nocardia sp. NBC_00565]|uniref:TetR/AcrR family transcriptional regulator n=1 Tax=Nocardia sp. NBC_00565 TaxID=2975993 RepID=UPI002E812A95|nr:TetR/AcrR family transcriptional regulator [Nocardia sp. NBC_00565]WUC01992.1 TetR/AcrR family transcriptional regulator [Nocardia sp. NBC_00565]